MKPRKNKRKTPLKLTLAAAFLGLSAVLLITLWVIQTVFLDEFYKTIKTAQVKNCAQSVCLNVEADGLSSLISDIEGQNSMAVSVYRSENGTLTPVYHNEENKAVHSSVTFGRLEEYYNCTVKNGGEYSAITSAGMERKFEFRGNGGLTGETMEPSPEKKNAEKTFDTEDGDKDDADDADADGGQNGADAGAFRQDYRDLHMPSLDRERVSTLAYTKLVQTEEREYLVIVESEITPVTSVVDTLRYQLIIMTAVLVVISVAVALLVARGIAKPISDTNEEAKKLARQNYELHFGSGRYKEISELNDTLTYAATELEKVDKLRKELIANISHDLRTPLTMITGYSEVMRDLPGEVTPENLQIVIDEANHLNSLVTDLLDISRLESGTADIKKTPFSLTRCIESIFSRYTKLIEAEGYNIRFEHDGEVFVTGDELRITQVLYNLINNAINYIGEDKTVIVRQTVSGGQAKVEVIDHGEGIPKEKLDYIWDRYYRVDKEHKQAKIGSGLGLSIVKNILKAHDAEFGVESELGKGSVFWFSLPAIEEE